MLTVYRASAGSGKTHKLTGEYLKLLFGGNSAYRHILAVTFTNKATDEMKGRIVEELYNLASRRKSDYIAVLSEAYEGISEKQVRAKAKEILITILHDYAAFNISTIDRFFQQTMRAFTREIGLQGGYGIEMDQELVLSAAIDNLLGDLEKPECKELLNWLLRFAEDKVENGGEWNLRREIMSLSREVFKENYKAFSEQVSRDIEDKKALETYKNELYAIVRSTEQAAKTFGEKGLNVMAQFGLRASDFKGGSRSPFFYFEKLAKGEMKEPTATFIGLADNEGACYAKTTPQAVVQIIGTAFESGLNVCIKEVISLFEKLTDYYTAKEIVRFYYTLGILNDVSHQIAAYRKEKNIMLIADTTELLTKVIDNSDTPFIYEKTGTYVEHYMIDEFQDTSQMQWNNFRPLIRESLAHKHSNLIVGDVKQSIYRFRNSDWKLLDAQVQKDFRFEQVQEETLWDNWRSFRQIVEFNNAMYATAPRLLQALYNDVLETSSLPAEEKLLFQSRIVAAYDKSEQSVPPKFQDTEGHIKVDFLTGDEDIDWKEEALQRLPAALERLQDTGYALQDIAILVRTNQEGASVADALLSYKEEHPSDRYRYDIISDDSLYVGSSSAVRFILALLEHLKNPDDLTRKQMALFAYASLTGQFKDLSSDFPTDVRQALDILSRQSIYEMTEGLFRLFADRFPDNEQVFVQAFFDMVLEFSQKENASLDRFLKWWSDSGSRKTIATPDGQNAIRILTIHKSKGLGFKVVILPFCDWEIDHRPFQQVILWCRPSARPFNRLHLVPVRYSQGLARTLFAKDYFEERLHCYIDNLNTLYVAFTRAKEELIVFAPRPKKVDEKTGAVDKISSISGLLWGSLQSSFDFDTESGSFEQGASTHPVSAKSEKAAIEIPMGHLFSVSPGDRLQLRLQGKDFFFDTPQRKYGNLMHEILSSIITTNDVSSAVENYCLQGIINREEALDLVIQLTELLSRPEVTEWFDGSSRILNEVDILVGKGQTRRPDRVMIKDNKVVVVDYKFGETQSSHYHTQVKTYQRLIRQMGYPQVEGYLWYISLNKIEAVEG
jgi:ATP-dependent exoDNAse (exonuclease V) beta subunit